MRYLLFLLLVCLSIPCEAKPSIYVDSPQEAFELSEKINTDVLIVFTGESCVYCDMLKEDIKKDPNMIKDKIVCYVDVAKNKEFTKKYEVRNIPDSRIFKKGKMVKKLVGYSGKKAYQEFIDK